MTQQTALRIIKPEQGSCLHNPFDILLVDKSVDISGHISTLIFIKIILFSAFLY